jgi:hypothetical protein
LELELVGLPYGRAIEWFARAMWLVAWIGVEKREVDVDVEMHF